MCAGAIEPAAHALLEIASGLGSDVIIDHALAGAAASAADSTAGSSARRAASVGAASIASVYAWDWIARLEWPQSSSQSPLAEAEPRSSTTSRRESQA